MCVCVCVSGASSCEAGWLVGFEELVTGHGLDWIGWRGRVC